MKTNIKIFETKPENFSDQIQASLCYVECGDRLLLLKRSDIETEPGCWGVPGGCIESNEPPLKGAHRELFEETGLILSSQTPLLPLGPLYFRKPEWELVFHLYTVKLPDLLPITLSDEHSTYLWTSTDEMRSLKLIAGFHELYDLVQKRSK